MTIDDPFANVEDTAPAPLPGQVIRAGRYRLPNRDGSHHKGGWMRVSNLVSAYVDQYALRQWEQRQIMIGERRDHGLITELLEATPEQVADPQWDEYFLEKCKRVAGGSAGADHGNERHTAVEALHRGDGTALLPSETRRMLALYQSTLQRHGLTPLYGMQERRVLVESLEVVGTLDNILRDVNVRQPNAPGAENLVADLKTQRKFWEFLYIGAQLATYAHGDAMWDPMAGRWVDMPPARQDLAVVLWMPRGGTSVDVLEVDIAKGWETAKLARKVVLDRQDKAPRAWLRPAPPVTETERYAAMFAGVDSVAEGRALTAECKARGIWSPMLADAAELAVLRLTKNVVS